MSKTILQYRSSVKDIGEQKRIIMSKKFPNQDIETKENDDMSGRNASTMGQTCRPFRFWRRERNYHCDFLVQSIINWSMAAFSIVVKRSMRNYLPMTNANKRVPA